MGTNSGVARRHRRRLGAAAAMALAVLLVWPLTATRAQALPLPDETVTSAKSAAVASLRSPRDALELLVRRREKALTAVYRAASRYAVAKAARARRLGSLGYTGDPDLARRVLPLASYRLSAGHGLSGPLWENLHTGQDFAAPLGTPLVAVAEGVVIDVGYSSAYGLRTVLRLQDGTEIWYAHQLRSLVGPGEAVELAQEIGLVGSTGNSTGPHLHLEVRPPAEGPIDPLAWLGEVGLLP